MKYELSGESRIYNSPFGETFEIQRIVSLKDFGDVKSGTLGGWVQSEHNLSQEGDCWIYGDAVVGEGARVLSNSRVSGNSFVGGNSVVSDNAVVGESSSVTGNSIIEQNSEVIGRSVVIDSLIREESKVSGNARVTGSVIEERAKIMGEADVKNIEVRGCARVMSKCTMPPVHLSGTIKDVTIADEHLCCGCVSMTFANWVKLAAGTREDFVSSLIHASNEFSDVTEKFTEQRASEIYDVLRRSLGFLGRIAQVCGRDVSGFEYIDQGYKLIVDPEMTDPIDTQNKIDPNHFFE